MIAVRVPHLPKLRRSIPFTGTLVFTRTTKTVRVFLYKKQSHGVTAPWLFKKVVMGLLMYWCLPLHGELVKNHNTQYCCNERCNHHNTRVVVGKEGSPERNQYDKQGK